MASLPLGPFPLGVDNVHAPTHEVFQLREGRPPRLTQALDVDLTDIGWPRARSPVESIRHFSGGDCLGVWTQGGRTFYQVADFLYEGDAELVGGLTQKAVLCEHAGRIYVSDGTTFAEMTETAVNSWGLPVPTVSLVSSTPALLPAGSYLVRAAFVDEAGNEGGASNIAAITLAAAGSIQVDVSGETSACVAVNIYASLSSQPTTSFVAQVLLASLPYTVSSVSTSADPPKTSQMVGPLSNTAGIFSFRAFLLLWRDNFVIRSEAFEPHLFHPDNIMQFPAEVRACAGLEGGMWIGTDDGLWWVAGEHPEAWIPARRSTTGVVPDCAVVDAGKLPALQSIGPAALFVQADGGLVAGTGAGTLVDLTDGRYRLSPATRASIAYVERGDLAQILIAVT